MNNCNSKLAPIALFAYNRLDTLTQTVDALRNNELAKESDLFIFSDGAKNEQSCDAVAAVRKYIKTISGFKNIKIIEKKHNCGLADSIIAGVTQLTQEFGKVIVVEDDLLTSPFFLQFMNDGLDMYQDDDRIISLHGYIYPVAKELPKTFFLRGADCWGWATWERGWKLFNPDAKALLDRLTREKLLKRFDMDGTYHYSKMLKNNILKKNNSWAIRWYASAFLEYKLTLYPGRSLVENIGNDKNATHCTVDSKAFNVNLLKHRLKLEQIQIEENIVARKEIIKYFRRLPFQLALAWLSALIRRPFSKKYTSGELFMIRKILQWIDKKQFEPGILGVFVNPFYSTRRCLFRNMKELGKEVKGKTLDIGCGQKPYEHLCSSSEYVGLDIENPHHPNHKADVFYDGNIFPFEDKSFDSVICNQVFEHVFNPDDFLGGINRVLKDNGKLLMTVPFVWGEHEQPNDYARYTTFAMINILEENGFTISDHRKTLNDFRLISQLLSASIYNYFYYKSTPKVILGIITILFLAPLNILGELIATITPKNNDLYMDQIIFAYKNSK